jgi:hypothetical protein
MSAIWGLIGPGPVELHQQQLSVSLDLCSRNNQFSRSSRSLYWPLVQEERRHEPVHPGIFLCGGLSMTADDARQFCHLIARLVDGVESLANHVAAGDLELTRLHNIRHDALMMLARLS